MSAPIGRFDPRYWTKRARDFREREMARDIMVLHEPCIRRVAVVEFQYPHGKRDTIRIPVRDSLDQVSNVGSLKGVIRHYISMANRTVRTPYIHRLWQVGWYQPYGSRDRIGWHNVTEWDRLVMAQGQLDALEYHYARHLMTRETPAEGM